MDNIPPMPDEADAPIIAFPRSQILRRAARTKIRKSTLPGDGEGHRFGPGRRRRAATQVVEPRTSSDLSSNDHASSEVGDSPEQIRRPRAFSTESVTSDDHISRRPDSYSEETSIYDAYVREEPESELSHSIQSLITPQAPVLSLSLPLDEFKSLSTSALDIAVEPPSAYPPPAPELQHPQPQRLNFASPSEESFRTPSPDAATLVPSTEETDVASTSSDIPITMGKILSPVPKKEKDKKGLFSKWGSGDKSGKKSAKAERDREKEFQRAEREKDKEKEKESGFFGSLFSGKKKQDDQSSQTGGYAGSGRETAAALLGASKSSKGFATSPSPQPGLQGSYARYPIHVERAIYRLSHIKLANPRRPLYEQVLISNLMFWYLGVINKTQNPTPATAPQAQPAAAGPVQQASGQEDAEGEAREAEGRHAENEHLEMERQEREREIREKEHEREGGEELQLQQQKEKFRRGTLTKVSPGQPGGRRAAEMPVKGPQYEVQHRVMEHEYNGPGYGYGSPSSSPGGASVPRTHRQPSPPVHQPRPIAQPGSTGYMHPGSYGSGSADPHLPPGAMAPLPASPAPVSRSRSSPSPPPLPQNGAVQSDGVEFPSQAPLPRRSRSPPPKNHNRYSPSASVPGRPQPSRGPTRSLSATVGPVAVPLSADGKARKVVSAHAVVPSSNGKSRASVGSVPVARGEEEDVPLAVWQQQRRR
ncbi:hypothetical protein BS17DRAFT_193128 [Gyrodon lividus]|nr:hypothetical protein BS17DRAFT_193128 [Gyrodon lividus]